MTKPARLNVKVNNKSGSITLCYKVKFVRVNLKLMKKVDLNAKRLYFYVYLHVWTYN